MMTTARPFEQSDDPIAAMRADPADERAYRGALRIAQLGRRAECSDVEVLILAELFIHQCHQIDYDFGTALESLPVSEERLLRAEAALVVKRLLAWRDVMSKRRWRIPEPAMATVRAILSRLAC